MELKIDYEFQSKIPPLTADELLRLQESIMQEGRLINPIVVWNGIIVDGHNRYGIIRQHPEIEYDIYEKHFDDRNRITYNDFCRKCIHECKQSFRATIIECPRYCSKRSREVRSTAVHLSEADEPP